MINDRIPPKYENREPSEIYGNKNRKIEQQKCCKEAPPNLTYSVLGFSLVRILHARRNERKLKRISHAFLVKIDINGLRRDQEHQSVAPVFFIKKKRLG